MIKIEKLKRTSDFKKIQAVGGKIYSQSFLIIYSSCHDGVSKVGYTASKKIGGAVQRNKCKRIMRNLTSDVFSRQLNSACDFILIARAQMLSAKYEVIKDEAVSCAVKFNHLIGRV